MNPVKTLVVTVPGMIGQADLKPVSQISDVTYDERASISEEDLAKACVGFDFLMLNYDVLPEKDGLRLSPEFYELPSIKSLTAIATDITGMDWASPAVAREKGITLLNIPHYSTQSVAESIVSEVLLHSRQRHRAYGDMRRGESPVARKGINLRGRTAGVVGYGNIGARVTELLGALGMDVLVWNRTPNRSERQVSLTRIFSQSEVLCVCVKTVKEGPGSNLGFVDSEYIGLLPPEAIVVNLANPGLVDLAAVVAGIESGRVSGYSVEWTPELLTGPLAKLDAVHFAPHNAWNSDESMAELRATWVNNVVAAINGEMQNVYTD